MATKPGRNDPCPCGSGKKYKRCCLPKEPPPERHPEPAGGEASADNDLAAGLAALRAVAQGKEPPKSFTPKQLDNLLARLPKRQRTEFAPVLQKLRELVAASAQRDAADAANAGPGAPDAGRDPGLGSGTPVPGPAATAVGREGCSDAPVEVP